MINNEHFINIARKEIQKAIIGELYKNEVIDFNQYNFIIKKIDEDIVKDGKENKVKNLKQIVVNFVI